MNFSDIADAIVREIQGGYTGTDAAQFNNGDGGDWSHCEVDWKEMVEIIFSIDDSPSNYLDEITDLFTEVPEQQLRNNWSEI